MRRIDEVECNDDDDEEEEEEEAEVELVVVRSVRGGFKGIHSWRREDFFRLVDRQSQSI